MATIVMMPKIGDHMTEGIIESWLKSEGEWVEKGEPLVAIMTEKISLELEAPASGILRIILHKEGEVVPVGAPIAFIAAMDEELPTEIHKIEGERLVAHPTPSSTREKTKEIQKTAEAPSFQELKGPAQEQRVIASPLAARIAREEGIDLSTIKGSGPGGRVLKEDVMKKIQKREIVSQPEVKGVLPGRIMPMKGIRRIIAQRMSESFKTIPHFFLSVEVDMTAVLQLREKLLGEVEKRVGVRLSITDILVKVAAQALKDHPIINSRIERDEILLLDTINIGVAMAIEDGLIVPVVHKADVKSLTEIAIVIRDLTKKARAGSLTMAEIRGGTFTLSNLGMFGIDKFNAIINLPECSILGVGRIVEKPVAEKGEVRIKPMAWLNLSSDHRIVDGATSARFIQRVKELLENPDMLLS